MYNRIIALFLVEISFKYFAALRGFDGMSDLLAIYGCNIISVFMLEMWLLNVILNECEKF